MARLSNLFQTLYCKREQTKNKYLNTLDKTYRIYNIREINKLKINIYCPTYLTTVLFPEDAFISPHKCIVHGIDCFIIAFPYK